MFPQPSALSCSLKGPLEAEPPFPTTLVSHGKQKEPLASPCRGEQHRSARTPGTRPAPWLPALPPAPLQRLSPSQQVPRQGRGSQETWEERNPIDHLAQWSLAGMFGT